MGKSYKILCKPLDWVIQDEKYQTYIDVFGISQSNKRILCRTPYNPWFHIYRKDKEKFLDIINQDYEYNGKKLKSNIKVEYEDEEKYDVHGYHNKKTKLTKVTFRCMREFYIIRKKCRGIQFFNNVDLVLKFTTDYNLSYSNWIEFEIEEKLDIGRNCKSYLTSNPKRYTDPLPPITPRVLSFDIEVMSSVKGTFPNAIRGGDNIFMCGIVFNDGVKDENENIIILDKKGKSTDEYREIYKDNEHDLIMELFNIINELDPDIIIGYNIFKFDLEYIEARLGDAEIPNLSRYKTFTSVFEDMTWKSAGRGVVEVKFIKTPGRIFMDLYPYIKSKYNLNNYKLNTVSKIFLKDEKDDLPPEQIFRYYEKGTERLMYKISKYCIQDCKLTLDLFKKLNVWYDINEASNATCIKLFDVLTRGQGHKAFHLEYIQMMKNDYFFYPFKRQSEKYEGAKVFMPKPNIYDNVITLDFASLYPSIMRRYNLCYTTLVDDNNSISDEDCYVFEWDDETKDGVTHCKYRFVKQHIRKGLLPILLEDLVNKRNETKKLMLNHDKDTLEYKILDLMQLYFKISANSVYGNKGTKTSKTPCYPVAKTTTYIGRRSIMEVANILQNIDNEEKIGKYVYGENYIKTNKPFCNVLYGDTDSVMLYLPSLEKDENLINIWDVGNKISEYINSNFEKPMKLEFEKVMRKFLPLSKKIYSCVLMNEKSMKNKDLESIKSVDISNITNIKSKGSAQVKRNYSQYCKEIYSNLIKMAFTHKDFETMIYYVEEKMTELLSYSVPKEKLILSLEVKGGKSQTHYFQVFIRAMRDLGYKLENNERVNYIYIDPLKYHDDFIRIRKFKTRDRLGHRKIQICINKDRIAVGGNMYLYDKYMLKKERKKYYKKFYVDGRKYFTSEISKQVDKIFSALFNDYKPNYMEKIKSKLIMNKLKYLEEMKYYFRKGECKLLNHVKKKYKNYEC